MKVLRGVGAANLTKYDRRVTITHKKMFDAPYGTPSAALVYAFGSIRFQII